MPELSNDHHDLKCIAFLVAALMLANCCALGNGCAPAGGNPVAWDWLGPAPTDDTQPPELRPKQHVRAKREIILGSLETAPADGPGLCARYSYVWIS
jgi:hypothetical protein